MKVISFLALFIYLLFNNVGRTSDITVTTFLDKSERSCRVTEQHVVCTDQNPELSDLFVQTVTTAYKDIKLSQLTSCQTQEEYKNALRQTFRDEMQLVVDQKAKLWTVYQDDQTLGFMFLEDMSDMKAQTLHIRQLMIHPDYQRNGIGKFLMQYVINLYPRIIIDTRILNKRAIIFYESLGFVKQQSPYDKELSADKYCGFEWKKVTL